MAYKNSFPDLILPTSLIYLALYFISPTLNPPWICPGPSFYSAYMCYFPSSSPNNWLNGLRYVSLAFTHRFSMETKSHGKINAFGQSLMALPLRSQNDFQGVKY